MNSLSGLGNSCCDYMFGVCTSLTGAERLILGDIVWTSVCNQMFKGCTSLTVLPSRIATPSSDHSYSYMFAGCTSLTDIPQDFFPNTVAYDCYESMFSGCTSLTSTPYLPATSLTNGCYTSMFNGCTSLSSINVACETWGYSATDYWLSGVAANGTFYCPAALGDNSNIERNQSRCPEGWTVVNI